MNLGIEYSDCERILIQVGNRQTNMLGSQLTNPNPRQDDTLKAICISHIYPLWTRMEKIIKDVIKHWIG